MNVLFFPCYVDGLARTSASARFRALEPAKHWPEADVYPKMRLPLGEYDAYIFQKAYLSRQSRQLIGDLRCRGKLLALDLCDADWLISDEHYRRLLAVLPFFDFAVAPTEPLREYLAGWLPAYVIPDRIDLDRYPAPPPHPPGRPPRLIWFGYAHNLVYLDAAWDGFQPVLDRYDLPLTILSNELPAEWKGRTWSYDRRPHFVAWTPEGADVEIAAHDIALVPPTTAYKSNNRTLTAWALGAATAPDPQELEALMNEEIRAGIVRYHLKVIQQAYDVRQSVKEWQGLLQTHFVARPAAAPAAQPLADPREGAWR